MSDADEIRVHSIPKKGRKFYYYRWQDLRIPGRKGECSSGFTTKSKADEGKSDFRKRMIASRPETKVTWAEFCERFETEYLATRRPSTQTAWKTARNRFNEIAQPVQLRDVNYSMVSDFAGKLRGKLSDASIATYLRTLRVALREAGRLYPSYHPPAISVESSDPRVRPLTEEELKAILKASDSVVGEEFGASWRFGIRLGSWTGLRRNQLIRLSWDAWSPIRVVDIDGADPHVIITKIESKGKREHRIGLVPPAVKILRRIPTKRRKGRVWRPRMIDGIQKTPSEIGRKVGRMAQAAGVVTGTRIIRDGDTVTEGPKYASLHDLKATFIRRMEDRGFKLSEIMDFAQHTDVKVTMHYLKNGSVSRSRINELFAGHDHKKKPKVLKIKGA